MLLLSTDTVAPIQHAERQLQFNQAVALEGSADPEALDKNIFASNAIEINLPAFNDGRGLSLGRYLRQSKGYTGVLRATGNILPDQLQAIFQLGFDEVLVGDVSLARQSEKDWLDAHQRLAQHPLPAYAETGNTRSTLWSRRVTTMQ